MPNDPPIRFEAVRDLDRGTLRVLRVVAVAPTGTLSIDGVPYRVRDIRLSVVAYDGPDPGYPFPVHTRFTLANRLS